MISMVDTASVAIIETLFVGTILIVALLAGLITVGLERQRKELLGIRKEAEGWTRKDLEIKRAKMASSVHVADPLVWLSQMATLAIGANTKLVRIAPNSFGDPRFILALSADGTQYLFSETTPDGLRQYRGPSVWPWRSRISRLVVKHPLVPLPWGAQKFELSTLNCGVVFDLEAAKVWESQVKEKLHMTALWLYVLPAEKKK
jgi:hypothetical protein